MAFAITQVDSKLAEVKKLLKIARPDYEVLCFVNAADPYSLIYSHVVKLENVYTKKRLDLGLDILHNITATDITNLITAAITRYEESESE